ncbi:V-type ATP synthase subunit E family protein [Flexistipes sinusarabici]|nr:V-type ATP synthase subunit E family protein [Flexistipes sinusarabici]
MERIREKADEEIEQLKKEHELQIEQLKNEYENKKKDIEQRFSSEKEQIRNEIKRKMEKSFQKEKLKYDLEIEYFISQKCREHAEKLAEEVWMESAEEFFERHKEELNKENWETLYVSDSDKKLAEKYFPHSKVAANEKISGGFIAENKDGTLLIDNTIKSRFEKMWPEILPEIMGKFYEELSDKI